MGLHVVSCSSDSFEQAAAGQGERIVLDHAAEAEAADRYVDPLKHPYVTLLVQAGPNEQEARSEMLTTKPMTDEVVASILEAGL